MCSMKGIASKVMLFSGLHNMWKLEFAKLMQLMCSDAAHLLVLPLAVSTAMDKCSEGC